MFKITNYWLLLLLILLVGCGNSEPADLSKPDSPSLSQATGSLMACAELLHDGIRKFSDERADRFLGKVQSETARCRGGARAQAWYERQLPWVDWPSYWATRDANSRNDKYDDGFIKGIFGFVFDKGHISPNLRGIDGALIDLEYERVELIKFNLFDNYTYKRYLAGDDTSSGRTISQWAEMRLPESHKHYEDVGGSNKQMCNGELIRYRTQEGICNDTNNPLMGSSNTFFARNVLFEDTFPDEGLTTITADRHAGRIGLMKPDPQLISRKLFTRKQAPLAEGEADLCNLGMGLEDDSAEAECAYQKAPFFNVLAAFWIQFMTHDWFSHLEEGNNQMERLSAGCSSPEAVALGCRENDEYNSVLVANDSKPPVYTDGQGIEHQTRAPRTFNNTVTAWWDASQIYGYGGDSSQRVKREQKTCGDVDAGEQTSCQGARLLMDEKGYLARFAPACQGPKTADCDILATQWEGQEWAAFPNNWTIGMSFYHNVFSREHNAFVSAFEKQVEETPEADSGLRNPVRPEAPIQYQDVTDDELFEVARLVVSAEIAKIHTIEWTTQLLYDDPLYRAMNSNWSGLLGDTKFPFVTDALAKVVAKLKDSDEAKKANTWYSVLAAGPGVIGTGSRKMVDGKDAWTLRNNKHVNGGTNHFGSPFNFPEEFTTVYRLHPLVPDLLELRDLSAPNEITHKIPAVNAFRKQASDILQRDGIANWAISMGRQRLGLLNLNNHGLFLQNLSLPHLGTQSGKLDIAALDLIRDREHGVPRYNEFRRQYGLKQLTSFDDFVNKTLDKDDPERRRQEEAAATMREIYKTHQCDASKIISIAQRRTPDSPYPNDCLGHPDGTEVDNIEDLDTVVGWLAEPIRPHGYAISETQFVVFILNASRRLFSDRFFTSSFRPEFYTTMGLAWVNNNGPYAEMEKGKSNGHEDPVSPMKRLLQRTIPELASTLDDVVNVFDPWARDRGDYYSLAWKPKAEAQDDVSFK